MSIGTTDIELYTYLQEEEEGEREEKHGQVGKLFLAFIFTFGAF